jgi:parallel beta-helix repeat protein
MTRPIPLLAAARRRGGALAAAFAVALLASGCGGGSEKAGGTSAATAASTGAAPAPATARTTEASGRVLRVPGSYGTIQAAVDASRPGDLVLIAPGVYDEAVVVGDEHPDVVIRGEDRNRVVLDGRHELSDGIRVSASGVAVENLTVRNYAVNGVVWFTDGAYAAEGRYTQGWRGSYLTAYDNGLYGLYAFGVQHGRFDNVYASGHPDSGIYVGRCKPCNALVTGSVTELNHVGLEFTNAGGDVVVRDNVTRRNRVGVQVNSLTKERAAPQAGMTIEDNDVADNQERRAPRGSLGFGAGIVINGGRENVVRGNRVTGHRSVGIVVLDSDTYTAEDNTIENNRLSGNRLDLALQSTGASGGNCFSGNRPATTSPAGLERATRCGDSVEVRPGRLPGISVPPQVDYRRVPPPGRQPNMPDARTAPARPAVGRPEVQR